MIQNKYYNVLLIFFHSLLSLFALSIGIYDIVFLINYPEVDNGCNRAFSGGIGGMLTFEICVSLCIIVILIMLLLKNDSIVERKDNFLQIDTMVGYLFISLWSFMMVYLNGGKRNHHECFDSQILKTPELQNIIVLHFYVFWILFGFVCAHIFCLCLNKIYQSYFYRNVCGLFRFTNSRNHIELTNRSDMLEI